MLAIARFVVSWLSGSMLPATDFDVLEYHLQGPRSTSRPGRIAFLPHNVYTNMPFGVEMLHLLGMSVTGDWWWGALAGQLLVALFVPAAAVLIPATAASTVSSRSGWFAALVYLSTPWVYRLGVIAYVEGPLCYYHAAGSGGWSGWRAAPIGPIGSAKLAAARAPGGRRDGLQVYGPDLGGRPLWHPRRRRSWRSRGPARCSLRAGMGAS